MQSTQREFSRIWNEVTATCRKLYGIESGNNARFVAETIFKEAGKNRFFAYAECGVYQGTTFLPIYHLCKILFTDFAMYALDSFSGFPDEIVLNENDRHEQFEMLFKKNKITKDHLDRARKRCEALLNNEHLRKEYFVNYADGFMNKCTHKKEVNIVKCSFSDLEKDFTGGRDYYDLVFLDCDLYLSYKLCLEYFMNKTDVFVFDEYYSLKYPGARIACDDFVERSRGWTYFNKIESGPYFERWGIERQTSLTRRTCRNA